MGQSTGQDIVYALDREFTKREDKSMEEKKLQNIYNFGDEGKKILGKLIFLVLFYQIMLSRTS